MCLVVVENVCRVAHSVGVKCRSAALNESAPDISLLRSEPMSRSPDYKHFTPNGSRSFARGQADRFERYALLLAIRHIRHVTDHR